MTQWLKQSTTVTVQFGPFVDVGDGVTPETGLATNMDNATTGIRVSKNGAAMVDRNSATAPSHDDDGYYRVELSATDTNTLGTLMIQYEESATCLPMWKEFMVVPANVWDSFFGADNLQVDTVQISGTAQTANDVGADVNAILDDTGTSGVVVATNNDKTGYALSAAGVDAIWDEDIEAAHGTDATAGFLLRVLGQGISNRANNANLNALLGVADVAGETVAHGIIKNQAFSLHFIMVDTSGNAKTAAAPTATRALGTATTFSAVGGTITEVANGVYRFDGLAADFNADYGVLKFSATGCKDSFFPFITVA